MGPAGPFWSGAYSVEIHCRIATNTDKAVCFDPPTASAPRKEGRFDCCLGITRHTKVVPVPRYYAPVARMHRTTMSRRSSSPASRSLSLVRSKSWSWELLQSTTLWYLQKPVGFKPMGSPLGHGKLA